MVTRRPQHGGETDTSSDSRFVPPQSQADSFSRDQALNQAIVGIHVLETKVERIETMIEQLVSKVEFWPVKMIAYGLASTTLLAAVTAVLSLIILKK